MIIKKWPKMIKITDFWWSSKWPVYEKWGSSKRWSHQISQLTISVIWRFWSFEAFFVKILFFFFFVFFLLFVKFPSFEKMTKTIQVWYHIIFRLLSFDKIHCFWLFRPFWPFLVILVFCGLFGLFWPPDDQRVISSGCARAVQGVFVLQYCDTFNNAGKSYCGSLRCWMFMVNFIVKISCDYGSNDYQARWSLEAFFDDLSHLALFLLFCSFFFFL